MKKFLYGIVIVFVLFTVLFLACYFSNPLVAKHKINFAGYMQIQILNITKNKDKLLFMAFYAYKASANEPKIEEYALSMFKVLSERGCGEADSMLGMIYTFEKNDTKKGLEYLEKSLKTNEVEGNYYLGLYYILKENNNEKGLALLRKAKKANHHSLRKINLDEPIDYESLKKILEKEKDELVEKEDMNVEFGW